MEIGQGAAGAAPQAAAAEANSQPRRVDDQETRRAVARSEEAEAQKEKREREAEQRAAKNGGVDVRA